MAGKRIAIVGGGIIGLSVAYKLNEQHPDSKIVLFEKETKLAEHQTGRNSGVIHSGIYYKPGSIKARTCRDGKRQLEAFCEAHQVAYERCGKVIVALNQDEIPALERIKQRGDENGVASERISPSRLKELEPSVSGIDALHVTETGIVDYVGFCNTMSQLLLQAGHTVRLGSPVESIARTDRSVRVTTPSGTDEFDLLVNCGGLYSDKLARMAGHQPKLKIVPFRGEYFELTPDAEHVCRNLIYPVPDPKFPFLGVHFTRMILGGVECGPNAVLAFAREGYTNRSVKLSELAETLTYRGFIKMAARHWRMGLGEMHRSFSKKAFVAALQRLVPEIQERHLQPAPAGVRAQAVAPDGSLVDDFAFVEDAQCVHVLNAPSPAATACLSIADTIVRMLSTRMN